MLSLQEYVAAESARWAASKRDVAYDEQSVVSSSSSTAASIFSSSQHHHHSKYNMHKRLSRRSSTSSFATEFEPEPEPAHHQPFVVPRDFNGAPITVYASLEAAVTQRLIESQGQGQDQGHGGGGGGEVGLGGAGGGGGGGEQPRRLVTPGKLYENEEDDDEIIYE
ncbi:hypothetical protein F5Y14DRAFT_234035 [Nemania sp. NC0429]|nr:hypothetical protein F5Y14DRAFT_234035 [Nemania sp. NC0429]